VLYCHLQMLEPIRADGFDCLSLISFKNR
jgi:hypothetical protein